MLCVDGQMCATKVRHYLKQYIPSDPINGDTKCLFQMGIRVGTPMVSKLSKRMAGQRYLPASPIRGRVLMSSYDST